MRTAGFVLMLAAAFWCSIRCVTSRRRAAEILGDFHAMLSQLAGELRRGDLPMEEVLAELQSASRGVPRLFLRALLASWDSLGSCTFQLLWQTALEHTVPDLPGRSQQEIAELGGVLGRYDAATQGRAVENCACVLKREEEKLRQTQPQYRHLVFGISLAAVGMLGILLI